MLHWVISRCFQKPKQTVFRYRQQEQSNLDVVDLNNLDGKMGKRDEWTPEKEAYFNEQIVGDVVRTNYNLEKQKNKSARTRQAKQTKTSQKATSVKRSCFCIKIKKK
jgi:hypothetical protein